MTARIVPGSFQVKRATSSEAYSSNYILLAGEIGLETDTLAFKFGDGVTPWRELPYSSGGSGGGSVSLDGGTPYTTGTGSSVDGGTP